MEFLDIMQAEKAISLKLLPICNGLCLTQTILISPQLNFPLLQPFLLNVESCNEPSFFQIVLWDSENKTEYRYGFEINSEKVVSEWLETTTKVKKNRRRRMIFLRKGQEFPEVDDSVKNSVGHLINNVRPTALALTVFAQFADPISSQVIKLSIALIL